MARIVKGFHSFTYTLTHTRLCANEMNHAFASLVVEDGPHFTDLGGMEG